MKLLKQSDLTLMLTRGRSIILGFSILASCIHVQSSIALESEDKPTRAQDLAYGSVLYEYHQGNAFEALSLLNVAKEKGGIKGHGDHPDLVEGGLLLSYGMSQEAKAIFENLLKEKLSIDDQNLAWFYLGKVFYLEQNYAQVLDSFNKINTQIFAQNDQEKFYELIYIKSQIASFSLKTRPSDTAIVSSSETLFTSLPSYHIFSYYIHYNQAVALLNGTNNEDAITAFNKLINALSLEQNTSHSSVDLEIEFKALYNQALLSLGQLYLQNNQNELSFNTLKQVDKDSVFSDQALFVYAISASNLKRYDLALSALNTLNERTLFNPWQQQTAYALAYLYEQLNEPVLALEAYRAAVAKYETLQENLEQERQSLSEEVLLDALNIKTVIGTETLTKDAYGRVQTPKQQFSFSKLLTTEAFQRQLSELHELYLLKNSMHRWSSQLDSFEDMLSTRLQSREQKLLSTKLELSSLEVDQWTNKEQNYKQAIDQAITNEDVYFFMTAEQIAYAKRLQKTQERLNTLPTDHEKKAAYEKRFQRAKAYFDWWVNDQYSVNRWRAVKQLKALHTQMTLFRKQHELLDAEQELDATHSKFSDRVDFGKERLKSLSASLNASLALSSQKLLAQVDVAMQSQLTEIGQYLLASREALARVSDSLLVEGKIRFIHSEISAKAEKAELSKKAETNVEGEK